MHSRQVRGYRVRALPLAAVVLALGAASVSAQGGGGRVVALRIKPRVGDTLFTRFEQQMEMVGSRNVGGADSTLVRHSSMLLLSRVMVLAGDDEGTTVVTITDSVAVTVSGGRTAESPEETRRALQGQRMRMRITPQGSATLLDGPSAEGPDPRSQRAGAMSAGLGSLMSQMPAMLPTQPVAVGETWAQMMRVPMTGVAEPGEGATLHVVYRLDSLTYHGNVAHISMRGTITRDSTAADLPQGVKLITSGSIVGHLAVDRRRGWWMESQATYAMNSTFTPVRTAGGGPMHLYTKITQRMETREGRGVRGEARERQR